jgi:hypothetical protein
MYLVPVVISAYMKITFLLLRIGKIKNKDKSKIIILAVCTGALLSLLYGLWYSLTHLDLEISKSADTPSNNEKLSIETLKSLPYVIWAPIKEKNIDKSGVTNYDPNLSYKGINLYYTENKPGGHFFDMQGNILHTFIDKTMGEKNWQFIEPYSSKHFIVLIQREEIFMIDWDSNIQWRVSGPFHHDISIAENGDIYTLKNGKINEPKFCLTEPIRNDWLIILMRDGKVKKKISFAKMILQNKELF